MPDEESGAVGLLASAADRLWTAKGAANGRAGRSDIGRAAVKITEGCCVLQTLDGSFPVRGTLGRVIELHDNRCFVQWQGQQGRPIGAVSPHQLLYAGVPNRYGFRYSLRVELVRESFERYKRRIGCPQHFPPSDQQRRNFEREMDALLLKGRYQPEELFGSNEQARISNR